MGILRSFLLASALLLSEAIAISDESVIAQDHKEVVDKTLEMLELSSDNTVMIYEQIEPFLDEDWALHWTTNDSLTSSRFVNSDTKVLDLMIYNNNRFVNVTFIHFKEKKQILYMEKEYVIGDDGIVMEYFDEFKADDALEKVYEADHYAYFQKEGFISYKGVYIEKPAGMISYMDAYTLDVK